MRIKKFFESKDPNLELLNDNIADLSDDFELEIKNVGKDGYHIQIECPIKNESSSIDDLDFVRKSLLSREKIVSKLKELIIRMHLTNYKIVIDDEYFISAFIDFSSGYDNPIRVDDDLVMYVSENKLKKFIKSKFELTLTDISLIEARFDDDPIELYLHFDEEIENEEGEKMVDFLSKIDDSMNDYSLDYNSITFTLHDIGELKIV